MMKLDFLNQRMWIRAQTIDIIRNSKQMGMPLKRIQEYVEGELKAKDIIDLIDKQLDFMSVKIDDLLKARNSMVGIRDLIVQTLQVEHNDDIHKIFHLFLIHSLLRQT